jgi:hypothetical protein
MTGPEPVTQADKLKVLLQTLTLLLQMLKKKRKKESRAARTAFSTSTFSF